MIFYRNRKWHICTEKVCYIQNGEEITQFIGSEGHDWWLDFEQKHEHTEIIEFVDVEATQEQLNRLDDVNQLNVGDGFGAILGDYVDNGVFPEGVNYPLVLLQLKKENEQQGVGISEREINEIIQGMQISDLEIQLLELQLGGE